MENVEFLEWPVVIEAQDCVNVIGIDDGKPGDLVSCISQEYTHYYNCEDINDYYALRGLEYDALKILQDDCYAYSTEVLSWRFRDNRDGGQADDLWCVSITSPAQEYEDGVVTEETFKGSICLWQFDLSIWYSDVNYASMMQGELVANLKEHSTINGNSVHAHWYPFDVKNWHKKYQPMSDAADKREPIISGGDLIQGFWCTNYDNETGCEWGIVGEQVVQMGSIQGLAASTVAFCVLSLALF